MAGSQLSVARPDAHVEVLIVDHDREHTRNQVLALVDRVQAGELDPSPGRRCRTYADNLVCQHFREPDEGHGAAEVRCLMAG